MMARWGMCIAFLPLWEDMVVMGNGKGGVYFYDVKTGIYTLKKSNHEMNICDLVKLDDYTFASCSVDKVVYTWRY